MVEREMGGGRALLSTFHGSYPQPISGGFFAEQGGRWLWVTPSGYFWFFLQFPLGVIISQFSRTVEDRQ
jgi:hypothetical protein